MSDDRATEVPTGHDAWDLAILQARQLISQMSLEELNNLTYGFNPNNGCSGISGSIPRLGYPGMCLQDGPAGSKGDLVSAFASGVSVAASFNKDLAYHRGFYIGAEFKRKGVQAINGPVVGPLGRIATDGRAWEGFGADGYLAGQLGAGTIKALQKSVIAVVKHYILNEQETMRYSLTLPSVSSNADDVTLHELYLTPFQDAVRAGAGSVMCAYNRINSTYACENDRTLNQLLKGELAFPGFVVSDWVFGQRSGLLSAAAGLDMAMPNSDKYWASNTLANAVQSGQLSRRRLEDMGQRILSAWFLLNSPDTNSTTPPGFGLAKDLLAAHELVDARDPESDSTQRQSAIEGHVLVKNIHNALPLGKPKLMSIFGYDAKIASVNYPQSTAYNKQNLGSQSVNITDQQLLQAVLGSTQPTTLDIASLGTLIDGGGSGSNVASYWIDPFSAITQRARDDRTFLFWDLESTNPSVSAASEACLVFINQFSTETLDRDSLHDEYSDTLVLNVANKCNNTIVVIHNAWIRLVEAWIDHPNVTAVLYAHLPGQESGYALTHILYGDVSPSGRLPYTVGRNESQYGSLLLPTPATNDTQSNFTEGINIDYRHFLANDLTPRYPFGYGLTYTNFSYSNIQTSWLPQINLAYNTTNNNDSRTQNYNNTNITSIPLSPPNPNQKIPGGIKSLFSPLARITALISNTGPNNNKQTNNSKSTAAATKTTTKEAAEVAQLYMQYPNETKTKSLRGFVKTQPLQVGRSEKVTFELTRRDLSRWDTARQSWMLQRGEYRFYVAKNVGDADDASGNALVATLTL